MGRNIEALQWLKELDGKQDRVKTMLLTGDVKVEMRSWSGGSVPRVFDISPAAAI